MADDKFFDMMLEAAQQAFLDLDAKPNPTPLELELIDDLLEIPNIFGGE